ncbi:hypothetical protein Poly21_39010 [Allorhodopirellula heiligendammensis]|uniref:Uncharacterized protein n=1 Tax=Allorhodopirellula heiligendammensis TaxID=2714739 RepID=A0A5C6BZM9_9BACT|nr:hypothetical protein Poly21_39010 [Allorhodopirellula heiligendammensis]
MVRTHVSLEFCPSESLEEPSTRKVRFHILPFERSEQMLGIGIVRSCSWFQSEQEVRVVFCRSFGAYLDEDGDTFVDPGQSSQSVAADFRVGKGDLLPYVKRPFSPLCVRRIICCGRSANSDNAAALRHFLLSRPDCGHIEVAVEPSLFR